MGQIKKSNSSMENMQGGTIFIFRQRREGELKMDFEETGYEYLDWIHLAQCRDQ
jgi:hypothetical protein